ncbi:GFA family protein [Phenylobacterium sp.]|uniref:GFA family protein n=1 Tax=Phenylobacterium sp. TaxID=1871053 RepID=UPI002600C9EA|nr:GFA family protein [Phenylobacterium sp.]
MSEIEGGCACGAVRFKISGELMGTGVCHCRSCQYGTGGGPNYVVLAPRAGFTVTKGEAKIHTSKADSGNEVGRAFCAECGTPLYTATGEGMPFLPVKVGALDDPSVFQPQIHLYMEDAQPWHLTHEGLPQFPKMPPFG